MCLAINSVFKLEAFSPWEISVDPLLVVRCVSDWVPPERHRLHLGAEVEEADRVKGVDVVAVKQKSDSQSFEEINPLLHVKDLELGQVGEVCDVVDAVAGGVQL